MPPQPKIHDGRRLFVPLRALSPQSHVPTATAARPRTATLPIIATARPRDRPGPAPPSPDTTFSVTAPTPGFVASPADMLSVVFRFGDSSGSTMVRETDRVGCGPAGALALAPGDCATAAINAWPKTRIVGYRSAAALAIPRRTTLSTASGSAMPSDAQDGGS